MKNYLLNQPTALKTPQSQVIPGREKDMTRNAAGAFAFKADTWERFTRFLILGSEGGSYYVGEQDLTKANVDNVRAAIAADGPRAVQLIVDVSLGGRAPKNDPALYCLAIAASCADTKTRDLALAALPQVARIGTHLFTFCQFIDSMRGWGEGLKRAVSTWYTAKDTQKLAYQLVKYQQRNGWSHRDVMRLAHPKPGSADQKNLFSWAVNGIKQEGAEQIYATMHPLLVAFERAKGASAETVAKLIVDAGLTREMIPTEVQKSPVVWEALLNKMPMNAMIRTLGRMGASGLLTPLSEASQFVALQLHNVQALKDNRVHPIQCLSALLTYRQGRGTLGSLTWPVVPQVVDALNDAFYLSFDNVEPTNKRFYMGIDVSGSMCSGVVAGCAGLTPNMGAAAMAMLVARTEPNHFIGGFADHFVDLKISAGQRLDDVMKKCQRSFGGTDCAIAINHALANKYPVDAFVVVSDGESWAGSEHTSQAIVKYRKATGIDAKVIVINMTANATSLGDPTDAGTLSITGFDSSVPTLISEFIGAKPKAKAATDSE